VVIATNQHWPYFLGKKARILTEKLNKGEVLSRDMLRYVQYTELRLFRPDVGLAWINLSDRHRYLPNGRLTRPPALYAGLGIGSLCCIRQ
jgi:hypothetical protein